MVMVINPPADGSRDVEDFRANALAATQPGYGTFANFSATAAAAASGAEGLHSGAAVAFAAAAVMGLSTFLF